MPRSVLVVIAVVSGLAGLAGGCVQESLLACGELSCPDDSVCTARGCATPAELEPCDGLAEGSACVPAPGTMGVCADRFCDASICGDGAIEVGEVCDDGNTRAGDGCSATCLSDETCGNGLVDLAAGEQCDEGVTLLSGDGCTSRCTTEFGTWQLAAPRAIGALANHVMIGTPRGVILYGGGKSETWLYSFGQWVLQHPRRSPPLRSGGALVFDAGAQRVLLIGGIAPPVVALADVWSWDGVDWTNVTPAGAGPAGDVRAAYDPVRATTVVIDPGGDIWERATGPWLVKAPPQRPSAREGSTLAWVPALQRVVLAGGVAGSTYLEDTWAWDGVGWSPGPGTGSPARAYAAASTDEQGNLILLGGEGIVMGMPARFGTGLRFDGHAWTALPVDAVIGARSRAALAYDPALHRMVLYGGGDGAGILSDTYEVAASYAVTPVARKYFGLGCNVAVVGTATRGGVAVITGYGPGSQWTGDQWVVGPSGVYVCSPTAAWDPVRDAVVVTSPGGSREFHGDRWTSGPPGVPSNRDGAVTTYDELHHRVVLFGGEELFRGSADGTYLSDTWTLASNGATWVAEGATTAPPPRRDAGLTFDASVGRVVMFGGRDGTARRDTWELAEDGWRELVMAQPPPAAPRIALATGPRGRPMLMTFTATPQLWELVRTGEHAEWVEVPTLSRPPAFGVAAMAYDARRAELVLTGLNGTEAQTWIFAFRSPVVPRDECRVSAEDTDADGLAGCADPDCAGRCDPLCLPYSVMLATSTCEPERPRCGDGMCSVLEDYELCPEDCSN